MSFSEYMFNKLNLNESFDHNNDSAANNTEKEDAKFPVQDELEEETVGFPDDNSGFEFGTTKIETPSSEGLDAAVSAADQFVDATDGQADDVDLSFHDEFPEDNSGFEKDAKSVFESEEPMTDFTTMPAINNEDDQFESENIEDATATGDESISPEELAADDDDVDGFDESATGWEDLI